MARLPLATRDSVPEDQRTIFDEMVERLGSVPRYGPGSVMIHVPKAHQGATPLNHYLREESSLPKKIQELAMLVTARELDCQHIWNAHAASARKAGVPNEVVDAARPQRAARHGGRRGGGGALWPGILPDPRVSRGAFQAALEQFGRQGVVELGLVMGNYSLLALLINSFDTDLPPDGPNLSCLCSSQAHTYAPGPLPLLLFISPLGRGFYHKIKGFGALRTPLRRPSPLPSPAREKSG